jgi:hypothetical protein
VALHTQTRHCLSFKYHRYYALGASVALWAAAFLFTYGIEFLCLIISKCVALARTHCCRTRHTHNALCRLLLLGRLTASASRSLHLQVSLPADCNAHAFLTANFQSDESTARASHRPFKVKTAISPRVLVWIYKGMFAFVIVCSVTGVVAYCAAGAFIFFSDASQSAMLTPTSGVFYIRAADLGNQAAGACDVQGLDTPKSQALFVLANNFDTQSHTAESVENSSEACSMAAIAFLVLYVWLM